MLVSSWYQLGSNWSLISKLMERAETWIKRNWLELLSKENITENYIHTNLQEVIDKLQTKVIGESTLYPSTKPRSQFLSKWQTKLACQNIAQQNNPKGNNYVFLEGGEGNVKNYSIETEINAIMNKSASEKCFINTESKDYDFAEDTDEKNNIVTSSKGLNLPKTK